MGLDHLLLGPLVLGDGLSLEMTDPRDDCISAEGLGPGGWALPGWSKANLLLSIEYDKLFPHCLQTLLQVSIL